MTTPKLQMPELSVGQAGKELTHNQAINIIDQMTQVVVISRTVTSAPASPANGDLYLVPDSGVSGVWAANQGDFAFWLTSIGVWTYVTPRDGWSIYVTDALAVYRRLAGLWVISEPVTGAASSANDDIARFSGPSGKALKAGLKYQTSVTDTTTGSLVIQGGTNLASTDTVAVGYATGSGGTVTQATSKSTPVTLNKPTGRITMDAAALAAGAFVVFNFNNSKIGAQDTVILSPSGFSLYRIEITYVGAGACGIRVTNISAGSLSDALGINFTVIKGAIT